MALSAALPNFDQKNITSGENPAWVCPEFKVSGIFSSHMVLQRDKPVCVWGFSDAPGTRIYGEFMNEKAEAVTGEDNRWQLAFSAHPASKTPETMTISDERGHKAVFEDILMGDVWFVGGQSNAELNLVCCLQETPDFTFDENENIRLFYQNQHYPYTHQEFCEKPSPDIICPDWTWERPTEEAAKKFSAMGFYFAREVSGHIDIPLGMVMMCAGGACLRELMTPSLAAALGYGRGNICAAGYYNSLIHPIVPLKFKGMLYFQGESEGCWKKCADAYDTDLQKFVADERGLFGQAFPFYNVQLSDYRDECFDYFKWLDIVRVKQFDALSLIPDSTLTVDMDLGSPEGYHDFAHSPLKFPLAKRLADLALAKEYGIGNIDDAQSPMPVSAVRQSDSVDITFKTASPLTASVPLKGFTLGPYENRTEAEAEITGENTVRVKIPAGADAAYVSYAFAIRADLTRNDLKNEGNLPAPAFSLPVANI